MNIIVTDKSTINTEQICLQLEHWLQINFAFINGFELNYKEIIPKIVIEEYMENISGDLLDYKINCFGGYPELIQVFKDRKNDVQKVFYDFNWNKQPFMVNGSP
jgi:hypothetical protein